MHQFNSHWLCWPSPRLTRWNPEYHLGSYLPSIASLLSTQAGRHVGNELMVLRHGIQIGRVYLDWCQLIEKCLPTVPKPLGYAPSLQSVCLRRVGSEPFGDRYLVLRMTLIRGYIRKCIPSSLSLFFICIVLSNEDSSQPLVSQSPSLPVSHPDRIMQLSSLDIHAQVAGP